MQTQFEMAYMCKTSFKWHYYWKDSCNPTSKILTKLTDKFNAQSTKFPRAGPYSLVAVFLLEDTVAIGQASLRVQAVLELHLVQPQGTAF